MASRKEQKEALRREREERERQAREAAQRRKLVGYGAGGALALAAIVGLAVALLAGGGGGDNKQDPNILPPPGNVPKQQITDLAKAVKAAGCRLQSFPANSRQHLTDPNQKVRYSSNPPTSGKHYEIPAQDGAYSSAPPDTALVHTQEHGRVIWWFKPSLPRDVRADLNALFQDDPYQTVLVPRSKMPSAIAATAWSRDPLPNGTGRLMSCPRFNARVYDALRAFREEHRGNGPEAIP